MMLSEQLAAIHSFFAIFAAFHGTMT